MKNTVFCSDECQSKGLSRTCGRCKKHFVGNKETAKFCSDKCRISHFSRSRLKGPRTKTLTCPECGITIQYQAWVGGGQKKYCGDACGEKARHRDENHKRRIRLMGARVEHENITIGYLIGRDKGICQICKKRVDPRKKWPDPLSPSLDHVIPISKGGSHSKDNAQLAHVVCNTSKGDRLRSLF